MDKIDREILDKTVGKTIIGWDETKANDGFVFRFSDGSFLTLEAAQETSLDGEEVFHYIAIY